MRSVVGSCAAAAAFAACLVVAPVSQAAIIQLIATLDGVQEVDINGVPGQGDADGTGTALVTIDDSTGPPTVSWTITVQNILLPPIGAHIHQAPTGVNGLIVVDFNSQLTGSGVQDPDLLNVIANPAGFYVNVHNEQFPPGAIRGQLQLVPEPTTLLLLGGGLAALALRRR